MVIIFAPKWQIPASAQRSAIGERDALWDTAFATSIFPARATLQGGWHCYKHRHLVASTRCNQAVWDASRLVGQRQRRQRSVRRFFLLARTSLTGSACTELAIALLSSGAAFKGMWPERCSIYSIVNSRSVWTVWNAYFAHLTVYKDALTQTRAGT